MERTERVLVIRLLDDLDGKVMQPLPMVEKEHRRVRLVEDLPGLDQGGHMGVSDALIDRYARMVRADELSYVDLADCFSLDEEQKARIDGRKPSPVDTSAVHWVWAALQRRALASHAAGICAHGYWVADLGTWLHNQLRGDSREKSPQCLVAVRAY